MRKGVCVSRAECLYMLSDPRTHLDGDLTLVCFLCDHRVLATLVTSGVRLDLRFLTYV